MVPIGLFLLFLTGVGPLFAWRRTSAESLRRNFQYPGIASLVLVGALIAAGVRHFYALISFGFCLFVALTVLMEFYKGAKSIAAKNDMNLLRAMVELTHRNTRRYGGYLVHMGIVLMFIGFTGHAFNQSEVKELNTGRLDEGRHVRTAHGESGAGRGTTNYPWHRATMAVIKNGEMLGTLEPEKRFYKASKQGTSEVGIRRAAERRSVPEFRRHERRQSARRDSGVCVPAGLLDLDRHAGGDLRHADLPGAEQGQTAVRPHGSSGVCQEKCDGSEVVCWF